MLNGEAIDGSPERAQHGEGDERSESEESGEIWFLENVKKDQRVEETVLVFLRIVEKNESERMVRCTLHTGYLVLVWPLGIKLLQQQQLLQQPFNV